MRIRLATLLLASLLLAGCATLEIPKSLPFAKKDPWKGQHGEPVRVVVVWSDAVYNEAGKPPIRGFGGRLYFYDKNNKTVPVEGQLVVYGYDDSCEGAPARKPDRKFAFTAEQFSKHFTPSELGASYSIWIPWEPAGGFKKTVSLLPVFTSKSGNAVTGQQTVNSLPGKTPDQAELQARRRITTATPETSAVQPASYQQPAPAREGAENAGDLSPPETPRRRLRSTTIPLSMALQRMLDNAGPQTIVATQDAGSSVGGPTVAAGPAVARNPVAGSCVASGPPAGYPTPNPSNRPSGLPAALDSAAGTPAPSVMATAPAELRPARFERPRYLVPAAASGR
ncbi:MAG: hypothetical protein NTY19_11810 [Planctomycetota bacterium]|nr:hypothetical protein [Planctomycetota bacterium]